MGVDGGGGGGRKVAIARQSIVPRFDLLCTFQRKTNSAVGGCLARCVVSQIKGHQRERGERGLTHPGDLEGRQAGDPPPGGPRGVSESLSVLEHKRVPFEKSSPEASANPR